MEEDKKKKGLVLIHGPKILLDFLCFYCDYGHLYEWTIICNLGRSGDSSVIEACQRSEIFDNVFPLEKVDHRKIGLRSQGALLLKMILHAIVRKQERICKNIIAEDLPYSVEEYDLVVIPSDFSLLNGAFLQLSNDIDKVILEDGREDYIERKWGNIWKSKFSFYEIQGFLLAMLGYANVAYHYPLRSTKNADKYARYPDELIYRKYKSISKLDFRNERYKEQLDELISKTFLMPSNENLYTGNVLLFTSYFDFFTDDDSEVLGATISYINKTCQGKKLILKKHPGDKNQYEFDPSIEVVEIDKHVPGELLVAKIDVKECIFMYPSTLLDEFMNVVEDYKILYYECLNKNKNVEKEYDQTFQECLENLSVDKDKIIYI